MRSILKQIILVVTVGLWLVSPSYAAPAAVQHHATVTHHTSHTTKHKKTSTHKTSVHKSSKSNSRRKKAHKKVSLPNDRTALTEVQPKIEARTSFGFFKSMEQRFVDHVTDTVNTLRYSAYKLGGTKYDKSNGVYVLDCSDYVDHVLSEVYPDAYSSLVDFTGSSKPTTQHYYDFFSDLDNDPRDFWIKVDDVGQLKAGDILVFRYKNTIGRVTGGHVMVVMDKPTQDDDAYFVRVADSAPAGHSEDTREGHVSGIGIGTLLLKANPRTGQPSAYAWRVGSRWNSNVKIAMARPAGSGNKS